MAKITTKQTIPAVHKRTNAVKKESGTHDVEADKKLFREYAKNKTLKIRNELARKNQPLVTYIVNKYYNYKPFHRKYREDLLQEGSIGLLSAIDGFDVERGFKFSTYACVPLSTQILTKRGWKKWNEIIQGDETIGFADGKAQWTRVNGIAQYDDAPLVRFGDSKWSVASTPQHKWLVAEHDEIKLLPLTKWPNSHTYGRPTFCKKTKLYKRPDTCLITSVPFVGGTSTLSPNEAAILAWVLSDGSLYDNKHTKTAPYATIVQSENKFAEEIRTLLQEEKAYTGDNKRKNNVYYFHVKASVFRRIWNKARLDEQSLSELVLDLTPEARRAWFNAWYKAEGTKGRRNITQNNGEKLDAVALTVYLEGLQDVQVHSKTKKCSIVSWHMRNRTPRRCVVVANGHGAVWCPNTNCGSWTARDENGSIFLTGNTWWIRQAVNNYLINIEPMIHVPSHVRTQQNKLIRKLNEENKTFQSFIEGDMKGLYLDVEENIPITNKMISNIHSAMQSRYINSLEQPIGSGKNSDNAGSGGSLKDVIPEIKPGIEKLFDQAKLVNIFREGLKYLTDRERYILLLRFDLIGGEEITHKESVKRILKKDAGQKRIKKNK